MAKLRIGTCSWKYPSWQGIVYSESKGINYLKEYAEKYGTVEIDQWFWSLFGEDTVKLPNPKDVEEYRNSVPDDFRFTVKIPNSITLTHFYGKGKKRLVPNPHFLSPELFGRFISLTEPLSELLGPLMFQFEYLNKQKMASQVRFLERVEAFAKEMPSGHSYALEIRNPHWINKNHFDFMDRHGLIPVLIHGYWMPSVVETYEKWRNEILGHEFSVIRLHGPDRKEIEKASGKKWDRIIAPKEDELGRIADIVKDMLSNGTSVFLNVNNHYEGSAPLTIERLENLMRSWRP